MSCTSLEGEANHVPQVFPVTTLEVTEHALLEFVSSFATLPRLVGKEGRNLHGAIERLGVLRSPLSPLPSPLSPLRSLLSPLSSLLSPLSRATVRLERPPLHLSHLSEKSVHVLPSGMSVNRISTKKRAGAILTSPQNQSSLSWCGATYSVHNFPSRIGVVKALDFTGCFEKCRRCWSTCSLNLVAGGQ